LTLNVMAEGSETPNGEGIGPEGRARRGDGDLFAERRARRAAESGEVALTRRAEAAEATVQTLERHVASLQQRLHEAELERARIGELVEAERAEALEREHELRRVKQREYAEQQLRVEAEERLLELDRDSRVEVERLSHRLSASEQDARELSARLDGVQRQLIEAEQTARAERTDLRAEVRSVAEQNLQQRLEELEQRAVEIEHGLAAEQAARARSERLLESMREGHRRMETLLGDMKGIVARVTDALSTQSAEPPPAARALAPEVRGAEMADALAAAVERLRARAEAVEAAMPATPAGAEAPAPASAQPAAPAAPAMPAPGAVETALPPIAEPPLAPRRERLAPVVQRPSAETVRSAPHKHSLSWIARRRIKRKQRRQLRGK
jgi:ribonuclease E